VKCVVHGDTKTVIGTQNAWWTGDQAVQAAGGKYRFLIYVIATDNQNVQWEFGHDPEMDVADAVTGA